MAPHADPPVPGAPASGSARSSPVPAQRDPGGSHLTGGKPSLHLNFIFALHAQGVCHVKACVFDDTLIMTGANLSDEYFRDRQDRYLRFKASAP
jgi:phosphatidylserine/phosphatidylglycerophosphate/cardiolipin synthase-like enzyme